MRFPRIGVGVMQGRALDTVSPALVSAVIAANGLTIALTYDEDLDTGSVPATGDYSLAGTDSVMDSVGVSGAVVTLTVDAAMFSFQTVLVDYTAGANPVRDTSENNAANLANQATTNNSTVTHPSIMDDGNTVKWFDYLVNVTKDGSDLVSSWDNAESLSGIIAGALLQATETNKPTLNANGILFDGVDNFMRCSAFTFEQPEFIYMVVNPKSWQNNDRFFDGDSSGTGIVYQTGTTPGVKANAGASSAENSNLAVGAYGIVRVLFNGASSALQVNETTKLAGNYGSNDMGGFTLGTNGAASAQFSNIEVKEIILRKSADSDANSNIIYNYLKDKYSL